MVRAKRKLSSSNHSERLEKRSHQEIITIDPDSDEDIHLSQHQGGKGHLKHPLDGPEVIDVDEGEEEDLGPILAFIKEQEESEALAGNFQDDWTGAASTSTVGAEVIDVDDDEDEGLAQELELATTSDAASLQQSAPESPLSVGVPRPRLLLDEDEPPDEKLLQFRDLFICERPCTKCAKPVKSPRGCVMFSSHPPPNLSILLHAPCSACRTNHCRGCFTRVRCPTSCKGSIGNRTCAVEACCANGRAIAIFETLGGLDRQYLGERATSISRAQAAVTRKRIFSFGLIGPGGTGYGSDGRSKGFWRRGAKNSTRSPPASRESRREQLAAHWEEIIARALNTLTDLLPSPYADSAQVYDMLPHPSLAPLLSLSQLPELLGSLLRNDSVMDWVSRSETYYAMLGLLRRMADCELTVQALITRGWEKEKSCGIEEWMWRDGEIRWARGTENACIERAPPLYDHFKKLTKQCQAFLPGASHVMNSADEGGSNDVEELALKAMSLCGDIIAARDDMERAMTILGYVSRPSLDEEAIQSEGKGKDTTVGMEKKYSLACESLAFKHVMLSTDGEDGVGLAYPNFYFASNLNQTASSTRNPKNRLHLVKELAVMATCLPPGVWVRVDEVRNDAIKVMIAGPETTPYAGGLFEFDCFMPIEYPNTPPLMHLRTTADGKVRFNPNLYSNGKVCLSLLGTWPGQ